MISSNSNYDINHTSFSFWGIFISDLGILTEVTHTHLQYKNKHIIKMKNYFTLILVLFAFAVQAQKADSVITQGGVNDVYYSFTSDEVKSIDRSTWDIGFNTAGFDASIIINESAGVSAYVYSTDTNNWASVDTTGMSWDNLYNSAESWSSGAFSNQGTSHPDYGWGTYNSGNHYVYGQQILIVQHGDGSYSQMVIVEMSVSGVFTVKIGDLGGANTEYFTVDKKDAAHADKNFILYDATNRAIVNEEPATEDWDILFTKYMKQIQSGPNLVAYPVSGVKVNKGYTVAERAGVAVSDNDTNSLIWTDNMTEIGSDWKTFNMSTFAYDITSDLAYFVKSKTGTMWKIYFTKYVGGAEGGFYFNIEKIVGGASVYNRRELVSNIYPNPANNVVYIANKDHAAASVSILDLQGRVVATTEVLANTTKEINTTALARGVYTVILNSEDATSTKRLIVE
jgi:hypothetical protein